MVAHNLNHQKQTLRLVQSATSSRLIFLIVYFRLDVAFVALLQLDILDTYSINRKIR